MTSSERFLVGLGAGAATGRGGKGGGRIVEGKKRRSRDGTGSKLTTRHNRKVSDPTT